MGDIVASVQQVGSIIRRISEASAEQARGITEVNQAVGQIDDVTQQNAALVEQAAAAAASLQEQAGGLAQAVAAFELGEEGAIGGEVLAGDADGPGDAADSWRDVKQEGERRAPGSPMRAPMGLAEWAANKRRAGQAEAPRHVNRL
jgi:methyl-accepting chemotaxis protein